MKPNPITGCLPDRSDARRVATSVGRGLSALILMLGLLLIPAVAAAEEQLSPEALSIANALNCPVCKGESVRDSPASIAVEMRQVIQQKLDQGESRQQIMDYFVQRYGVTILREPPHQGFFRSLWWMPAVAVAVGLIVLVLFVLQGGETPAEENVDPAELRRYEELIGHELTSDGGAG